MQKGIRKCSGIPVITVQSSKEHHQEIILSTITKRAYQIFEEREHKHGFGLDDWLTAEKELWRDDSSDPEPNESQSSGLSKSEETY